MEKEIYSHESANPKEAEQAEYKKKVHQILEGVFKDVLSSEELTERLQHIDATEFVTPEQMQEIAESNPQEAGALGLIRYEVSKTGVKRYPVVMRSPSQTETLHTLLHESVHLMTPRPTLTSDSMRDSVDQTFADYVGAYRFERLRKDNFVDSTSLQETFSAHNARMMFWEAVTDWIATNESGFTTEELKELEYSGYFERYWIYYLAEQCSDKEGLVKALKESYVQGTEDNFRWFLQKITGRDDDKMYDELLGIMGRERKDENRVDEWMRVVKQYFQIEK